MSLHAWMWATFFLGLGSLAICWAFLKGCERI